MFNWLRRKPPTQKASAAQPLIHLQSPGEAIWTPRKYDKFAEEGYQKNIIAYRSIGEVASSAAQANWLLFRVDRSGNRMEVNEHELKSLFKRPNPTQGGSSFIEAVTGFYNISGNAYIESVAPTGKPTMELHTLRPDRMTVLQNASGPIGYKYTVNGQSKEWKGEEKGQILHVKTFNPLNDWYGLSPLEAAAFSVDVHNSAMAWNKSLLDNRAQPSGVVTYKPLEGDGILTDDQYERLRKQVDEQYSGVDNAGRPMLLEGFLSWQQIGLSPQDMDYINSKHVTARDIASAFGVPPMLLGIPGDNTYSNQKEARIALWEQTILPWLYKLRDEFNNWLTPQFDDSYRLEIDEDSISALSPRRESRWEKVQTADFLTINEKREAVGYEPIKGGDQVLVSATMLPLGFTPEQTDDEKSFTEWLVEEQGYSKEAAVQLARSAFNADA